ncbi:SRPBCC family protein [Sphingomonas crocodyli]|uniref:SRPBCC domain-containing protein n=1 Tax=Sphingomonas crocodyli TaxID=1979270 RepID=A0A437M5T9_9SPHN|nr:SRPBCC family protein [Sphingomonas crocodyli]RVT93100.1 hypothetical protein EOD43_04170 [Sphingomonas crocodyli]
MVRIRTATIIPGSPLRTWTALVDGGQRRAWHPIFQLTDPIEIGITQYKLRLHNWKKPPAGEASVDVLEKPKTFSWSCGLRFVLTVREIYELEEDGAGTYLTHSLEFRGILARLVVAAVRRNFAKMLAESDDRLSRYLRWRSAQTPHAAGKTKSSPRHGRKSR